MEKVYDMSYLQSYTLSNVDSLTRFFSILSLHDNFVQNSDNSFGDICDDVCGRCSSDHDVWSSMICAKCTGPHRPFNYNKNESKSHVHNKHNNNTHIYNESSKSLCKFCKGKYGNHNSWNCPITCKHCTGPHFTENCTKLG